jgi:hypothetical protein
MARKKMFIKLHPDIRVKNSVNKIEDIWLKIGQCLIKYKDKWERVGKKSDERDEER